DPFASLLGVGITSLFAMQVLINIAVVIGLVPTKGLPLPFLSYGGSSIMMVLAQIGVLLALSRRRAVWLTTTEERAVRQPPRGLLSATSEAGAFAPKARSRALPWSSQKRGV